jgi:hypothetical protein
VRRGRPLAGAGWTERVDSADRRSPVQPGDPAPDFVLPAVDREGTVSLADYRGRTPVLLATMRGLYCAFCRRHIRAAGHDTPFPTDDELLDAARELPG